ncbi:pilus assembly PilX family protein [Sansalvadorimonas verongulae]|uniref:pilus assembly PilX family protein n=1 Tax=Sansalvadorimonas verongulae TaxID=2172824 RepID=UPI0018AD2837|nr:PilX N-terminal domain-containing pilus assembly protein [Sansalvadorimonas verongulae]
MKRLPQQHGAALVVAMILLTLLTLMGTDSMRTSMLDMHLSKGFQDQNHAFQIAETGLRLAEEVLQTATTDAEVTELLTEARINIETGSIDYHDSSYWNLKDFYDDDYLVKIVVQRWRYISDSLAIGAEDPSGIQYYRITARGTDAGYAKYLNDGNNENYRKSRSVVVLQSIYAARHN